MTEVAAPMSEAEFIRRFADRLIEVAGTPNDVGDQKHNEGLRQYAATAAPTYYSDVDPDDGAYDPEGCADVDMGYW